MAVQKEFLGLNEDGTPHFRYYTDDPSEVLVVTGPLYGTVQVDGEDIDVSADVIAVESMDKALKVSDAIGEQHVANGHPAFLADPDVPNDGFVHVPSSDVKKTTTRKKG